MKRRHAADPEYKRKHRESAARSRETWTLEKIEAKKQYCRGYYQRNRERMIANSVAYEAEKRKTDIHFRLRMNLRARLHQALKREFRSGGAIEDLGCSIPDFKAHLESKFQSGMSWENWGRGKGKWHIDHIFPLAAFDLTNRQHVVLACYYLNLQPLWEHDNVAKGGLRFKKDRQHRARASR